MKKLLIIRRKNIIVGLLVTVLIVTGYLNFVYNQSATPAVNPNDEQTSTDKKESEITSKLNKNNNTSKSGTSSGGRITVSDVEDPEKILDQDSDNASSSLTSTFFRDYRFEREQERNKEVTHINSIVDNPNSDADMIKEAQEQLLEIASNMEAELVIENLIKAKGIQDAIVIIHRDNVNVIVDKSELVPEEAAMILDIVKRESDKDTNNIKIIPKI